MCVTQIFLFVETHPDSSRGCIFKLALFAILTSSSPPHTHIIFISYSLPIWLPPNHPKTVCLHVLLLSFSTVLLPNSIAQSPSLLLTLSPDPSGNLRIGKNSTDVQIEVLPFTNAAWQAGVWLTKECTRHAVVTTCGQQQGANIHCLE